NTELHPHMLRKLFDLFLSFLRYVEPSSNCLMPGGVKLPEKRNTSKKKSVAVAVPIPPIRKIEPMAEVAGRVEDFAPLDVELVETKEQRQLFRDLVRESIFSC
ncbi:MAG: hypothetical protein V1793_11660, partial [Pseudomonadota bacterium]